MSGRLPTIFFGHGSPIIALKENDTTATWRRFVADITRPRAILCISAHWITRGIGMTAQPYPPTIHDFGGFPREMHEFEYRSPGAPWLVDRVRTLLAPVQAVPTDQWGYDHGSWTVMMKIYPDADIPVVQLSLDATRDPAGHYALGRALRPLRDEGILIIGSGNIVHNLSGVIRRDDVPPHDYAANFSRAIKQSIIADDPETAIHYSRLGVDASRSVPTPDHFWPLLYVLGARHDDDVVEFAPDFIEYGSIDMTSVRLSAPTVA